MSKPVMPTKLIIFKMVRTYEKTNKTQYSIGELLRFVHNALQIAGEIDNEEYWILSLNKMGTDFHEKMSNICDVDMSYFVLNEEKFENGGKEWAENMIELIPNSFLKGAEQVLCEELKEKEEVEDLQCV